MASGDQNLSCHREGHHDGETYDDNNSVIHIMEYLEPLFAPDLTVNQVLSTDDQNCNLTKNSLVVNRQISQNVCDRTSCAVLSYISQILLEEDIDNDTSIYPEEVALWDTEKSFYEILGKEYPSGGLPQNQNPENSFTTESTGLPLLMSKNFISADLNTENGSNKLMNFHPTIGKHYIDSEPTRIKIHQEPTNCISANPAIVYGSSGIINSFIRDPDLSVATARKQRAIFLDEPARNERFDEMLLSHGRDYFEDVISLREIVRKEIHSKSEDLMVELSDKMALEMLEHEEGLVDIESLLISCSSAVSVNDQHTAHKLIKEIRKHSTPLGNGYQRLAHYIVHALEARLAGTGSDTYHKLISNQGSAMELLSAARVYHAVYPYPKASCYVANETILNVSRNASKIHIIDFGIDVGYQWPSFFERLSYLGSSRPKIRITGICFPEKGFRPSKVVQETGRRLSEYAQLFNIHFKYQGIASKWENITVEDLRLDNEEILIVSSLYRFRNLGDETINMDSARDKVLRLIRTIKPRIFIHGIINLTYGNPFFTTRFKNVMSSFYSFFDMFDSTMPRDSKGRLLAERNILFLDAVNAIACEGSERVERPETYRQWKARNVRAGFEQLPVDPLIKKKIERTVTGIYHHEFVVDEKNKWLLLGWKGSMAYALSTWKPK